MSYFIYILFYINDRSMAYRSISCLTVACMLYEGNQFRDHNNAAHLYLRAIHNFAPENSVPSISISHCISKHFRKRTVFVFDSVASLAASALLYTRPLELACASLRRGLLCSLKIGSCMSYYLRSMMPKWCSWIFRLRVCGALDLRQELLACLFA